MNAMTFSVRMAYFVSSTSCLNDVTVHTWTRIFYASPYVRRFRSTYRERDTHSEPDQGCRVIENFSALNRMDGPHVTLGRITFVGWYFEALTLSSFHSLVLSSLFRYSSHSATKLYYLDKQWQCAWQELQCSDEALENFITRSDEIRGHRGWSNALFFFMLFIPSYFYQQLSAGKSSRRPSGNFHFYLRVAAHGALAMRLRCTSYDPIFLPQCF